MKFLCKKVYKNGCLWYFFFVILQSERIFYLYMTTFIGDIECKLDTKGRILFPAAYKKQLPVSERDTFVIKKDIYEKCLIIYPIEQWEKQVDIIRQKINPYNKEHSKFLRGFYKNTAETTLDANNRMLIPKSLLSLIDAKKDLRLIGLDEKIEIWAKENYDNLDQNEDDFASLAEKILGE